MIAASKYQVKLFSYSMQSCTNFINFEFRVRAKSTSTTLKEASVPAAKALEEVQLDVTHSKKDSVAEIKTDEQSFPVCAYNEWDPLEVYNHVLQCTTCRHCS